MPHRAPSVCLTHNRQKMVAENSCCFQSFSRFASGINSIVRESALTCRFWKRMKPNLNINWRQFDISFLSEYFSNLIIQLSRSVYYYNAPPKGCRASIIYNISWCLTTIAWKLNPLNYIRIKIMIMIEPYSRPPYGLIFNHHHHRRHRNDDFSISSLSLAGIQIQSFGIFV